MDCLQYNITIVSVPTSCVAIPTKISHAGHTLSCLPVRYVGTVMPDMYSVWPANYIYIYIYIYSTHRHVVLSATAVHDVVCGGPNVQVIKHKLDFFPYK